MLGLLLAIALAGSNPSPADKSWAGLHGHACPQCTSTRNEKLYFNDVVLPGNVVAYFFAGEFAVDPELWLIDLDSGSVTHCSSDNQSSCRSEWSLSTDVLLRLRRRALKVWQRPWPPCNANGCVPPTSLVFAPGTMSDCYIRNGNRMARFDPLDPRNKSLTDEVERTIRKPAGQ